VGSVPTLQQCLNVGTDPALRERQNEMSAGVRNDRLVVLWIHYIGRDLFGWHDYFDS
jgi:hypothetical protein